MKVSRNYLRRLIREAVEAEMDMADVEMGAPPVGDDVEVEASAEEVMVEPEAEAPEDDRVTASMGSLRGWLSDTLTSVDDMGIQDNQVPALVAAMDDLIASAQAGQLSGSEDRVRKGITDASGVDRSEME